MQIKMLYQSTTEPTGRQVYEILKVLPEHWIRKSSRGLTLTELLTGPLSVREAGRLEVKGMGPEMTDNVAPKLIMNKQVQLLN